MNKKSDKKQQKNQINNATRAAEVQPPNGVFYMDKQGHITEEDPNINNRTDKLKKEQHQRKADKQQGQDKTKKADKKEKPRQIDKTNKAEKQKQHSKPKASQVQEQSSSHTRSLQQQQSQKLQQAKQSQNFQQFPQSQQSQNFQQFPQSQQSQQSQQFQPLQQPQQASKTPKHSGHKKNKKAAPQRITHKMARRRRLIKRVITAVVSSVLLAICVFMSLKLLFIVRTVEVSDSALFSSSDIINFCAIPPESNIFSVNTKELQEKLAKEFTYIESVKVQKKLPDKISITITDSVESYYNMSEDKINIYSQSFRFLRTGDTIPSDMLCLDFDMQNKVISDLAVKMIELFKTHEVQGITVLSIAGESDIRAMYDDRLEINFGTILDIDYKIKMFKKLIDENKISAEEKGVLDATKSGEIVYKRQ